MRIRIQIGGTWAAALVDEASWDGSSVPPDLCSHYVHPTKAGMAPTLPPPPRSTPLPHPHFPHTVSLSSDLLPEKATMVKVVMHTPASPANTSLL